MNHAPSPAAPTPTGLAIETHGLGKRFGERAALDVDRPRGAARLRVRLPRAPTAPARRRSSACCSGSPSRPPGPCALLGHDLPADRAAALARVGAIVEEPRFHRAPDRPREPPRPRRGARRSAHGRVDAALERVGLAARADDKVGTYSLGMRQRLGVARCLLCDPELLILDEPVNGLDPAGILEFRDLIRSLVDEGRTVLLSSHLLDEVEKTCDLAAIVDNGARRRPGHDRRADRRRRARDRHRRRRRRWRPPALLAGVPGVTRAAEHDGGIRATLAPRRPATARSSPRCCAGCSPTASRSSASRRPRHARGAVPDHDDPAGGPS